MTELVFAVFDAASAADAAVQDLKGGSYPFRRHRARGPSSAPGPG